MIKKRKEKKRKEKKRKEKKRREKKRNREKQNKNTRLELIYFKFPMVEKEEHYRSRLNPHFEGSRA